MIRFALAACSAIVLALLALGIAEGSPSIVAGVQIFLWGAFVLFERFR